MANFETFLQYQINECKIVPKNKVEKLWNAYMNPPI